MSNLPDPLEIAQRVQNLVDELNEIDGITVKLTGLSVEIESIEDNDQEEICQHCDGNGEIIAETNHGRDWIPCPYCKP